MTEASPAAGGREEHVYPETKGREYKEVSRLAETASQRRQERRLLLCLLIASTPSDRARVGRETLPGPCPRGPGVSRV